MANSDATKKAFRRRKKIIPRRYQAASAQVGYSVGTSPDALAK
jgi:hypothetical protein